MSSEDQIRAESVVISAANSVSPGIETNLSFAETFKEKHDQHGQATEAQEQTQSAPADWHYKLEQPGLGGTGLSTATVINATMQTIPEKSSQAINYTIEKDHLLENPITTHVSLKNDFDSSNGY